MKKNIIFCLLASVVMLVACKKENDGRGNLPELERVPVVSVTADPTADLTISAQNPATFSGKFTVDLFFKSDEKPSKVDIVVIKNGDKGNVKLFKSGVTTFPTTFTISGTELTTLFGTAPVLGDQYDFGADVYALNGKKYEAFPAVGASYGASVTGQSGGVSVLATYKSVCKFVAADYAGTFKVVLDPWQDFLPGQTTVVVSVVDASTLSFPSPVSGNPVILKVNTVTNEITVNSPGYGNYGSGPIVVVSAGGSAKNFVSPCQLAIDLNLRYTIPTLGLAYSGEWPLRLVKQ